MKKTVSLLLTLFLCCSLFSFSLAEQDEPLQAMDLVTFGTLDSGLGAEPLEWVVIDCRDGIATLMTRYAVQSNMPFNAGGRAVSWAESSLCAWLNGDFLTGAFTPEEQGCLQPVDGGYVTLVTSDQYFEFEPELCLLNCTPSYYTANQTIAENEGYCFWWVISNMTGQYLAANAAGTGCAIVNPGDTNKAVRPVVAVDARAAFAAGVLNRAGSLLADPDADRIFVTYGSYPQSLGADGQPVVEPIEWIVLYTAGDTAVLISRYVLDAQPWRPDESVTTWEASSLRAWLNSTFMNTAFTAEEQGAMLQATVTEGVFDYVSCLTAELADYVFPTVSERKFITTEYADSKEPWIEDYWLSNTLELDGDCYIGNYGVSGAVYMLADGESICGVRPVIIISLSTAGIELPE